MTAAIPTLLVGQPVAPHFTPARVSSREWETLAMVIFGLVVVAGIFFALQNIHSIDVIKNTPFAVMKEVYACGTTIVGGSLLFGVSAYLFCRKSSQQPQQPAPAASAAAVQPQPQQQSAPVVVQQPQQEQPVQAAAAPPQPQPQQPEVQAEVPPPAAPAASAAAVQSQPQLQSAPVVIQQPQQEQPVQAAAPPPVVPPQPQPQQQPEVQAAAPPVLPVPPDQMASVERILKNLEKRAWWKGNTTEVDRAVNTEHVFLKLKGMTLLQFIEVVFYEKSGARLKALVGETNDIWNKAIRHRITGVLTGLAPVTDDEGAAFATRHNLDPQSIKGLLGSPKEIIRRMF